MSTQSPLRWRTAAEIAAISLIIYLFLGSPGWSSHSNPSPRSSPVEPANPTARAQVESLVKPRDGLSCPSHTYRIHVFSSAPLVIYIEDFVSTDEADHLVALSQEKWQISTVFNQGVETTDETVRKSEKALINRDDTVQCIEQRALQIQGWPAQTYIERLWTQRYNVSGHYAHHYDWARASKTSRRSSTFMVYLSTDDLEGGGTNFPRLAMPEDQRWCDFVECPTTGLAGEDPVEGVTFRARKGAAIYWQNFDPDGRGYKDTLHAGMPVRRGTKIGLNIWSWYQSSEPAWHT